MATKNIKKYIDSIAELVDFNFYYLILVKYKKILLIIPLIIAALAYLITLNLEPIYQSSATLVIESKERSLVENIDEVYTPENPINRINNQIQILKSDEVLEYILRDDNATIKFNDLFKETKKTLSDIEDLVKRKVILYDHQAGRSENKFSKEMKELGYLN